MNRCTYLEVNLKNFKENIEKIKKYCNKELMPVVKANCYGTYINNKIDLLNEFNIVAVSITSEGVNLRKNGYKNKIFILNQPVIEDIDNILKYDLIVGLSSMDFLNELIKQKKNITIHLELETGMNRTGIYYEDLGKFINKLKNNKYINVEGVYTHLSCADSLDEDDINYTNKQINLFYKGVNKLKKYFNLKYIHYEASSGILNYNDNLSNLVRPGIIMYGYINNEIDLKPTLKLISKISFLKTVKKNSYISYSRTYKCLNDMKVATIPLGYNDGIRRVYKDKGFVVINKTKCKIIGTICMDSFMVDVSNLKDVKVGDLVYIWDNDIITLENVAKNMNTIPYEIMSTISDRVERIYID